MAARELDNVKLGVDSSGNPVEPGSFAAEQAALANAGAPPLIAQPATYSAEQYAQLALASAAWLAIPLTMGAGAAGMKNAVTGVVQTGIKGTASAPSVPGGITNPTTDFPSLTGGPSTKSVGGPGFFARLFAFAFPRV
jgi:hypothetical protein